MIAVSEFDQTMYEDGTTVILALSFSTVTKSMQSRWQDAEILYEATTNSRWLSNALLVLFLNKCDLFQDKIEKSNLSDWFPEYLKDDDRDVSRGLTFLQKRLTALHRNVSTKPFHSKLLILCEDGTTFLFSKLHLGDSCWLTISSTTPQLRTRPRCKLF